MQNGIFFDIGAHNGITISNTYFFEKDLHWSGVCVEPIPSIFKELKRNRKCIAVEGCVTDFSGDGLFCMISGTCQMLSGLVGKYDPRHVERIKQEVTKYGGHVEVINVRCYQFNELMDRYGLRHIHYLSIDTEGGEFDILSTIDFNRYRIDVISVEDNFLDPRFIPFLESKGFRFIRRLEMDLIFANKSFFMQ